MILDAAYQVAERGHSGFVTIPHRISSRDCSRSYDRRSSGVPNSSLQRCHSRSPRLGALHRGNVCRQICYPRHVRPRVQFGTSALNPAVLAASSARGINNDAAHLDNSIQALPANLMSDSISDYHDPLMGFPTANQLWVEVFQTAWYFLSTTRSREVFSWYVC